MREILCQITRTKDIVQSRNRGQAMGAVSSGACGIEYVGLDVHKERTMAAIVEGGLRGHR